MHSNVEMCICGKVVESKIELDEANSLVKSANIHASLNYEKSRDAGM